MAHSAEYAREYRARRKAEGRPVPSGTRVVGRIRVRGKRITVRDLVDPDDYSHPMSDVRRGP